MLRLTKLEFYARFRKENAMSNPNQRPKTTDEILSEMQSVSGTESNEKSDSGAGGALKSLLGFFVKVAPGENEIPVVEKAPATPPPAPRPRVSELVPPEPAPKFSPASSSNLADKPFEEIYREASLPISPCSVDELANLLSNPTIAAQPLNIKVVAVSLTLSSKGLTLEAPVADAVRRDRILDAYQAMLADRVTATEQANAQRIENITKEVEEYLKEKQAEMDVLKAEIASSKKQSVEFSIRREVEEKRMADLISPFLEGKPSPVTVGNDPTKSAPSISEVK